MLVVDTLKLGCAKGWRRYENNPVIGGELGECFDVSVLKMETGYRMYFSWRSKKSIAVCDSPDGLTWSDPIIVLGPNPDSGWEDDINRISVIRHDGLYHMWYSPSCLMTLMRLISSSHPESGFGPKTIIGSLHVRPSGLSHTAMLFLLRHEKYIRYPVSIFNTETSKHSPSSPPMTGLFS